MEAFDKVSLSKERFHVKLRPKTNNLSWMMYLVGKFTNQDELIVDWSVGT